MTRDGYSRSFSFGPIERRGIVGALRLSQTVVLGCGSVAAVIAVRALPAGDGLAIALIVLVLASAIAFGPVRGRTLEQWAPVLRSWIALRTRQGSRYRSARPSAGVSTGPAGAPQPSTSDLPESLVGCEILAVPVEDGHDVGVLRDPSLNALTAVLAVRVRAFGLLAEREQERRLERWGQVLASAARNDRLVRRVCVLERTVPSDGDEMQRYLVEAGDAAIARRDPASRSYLALLEGAGDLTQDHELFVGLQVSERRAHGSRRGRHTNGSHDALASACRVLVSELHAFASRFDPGDVIVDGALSARTLARTIRLAYDPYGRARTHRFELVASGDEAELPAFGPISADIAWDSYRTDSAVHRTYWVAQWPRLAVGPSFLTPLLISAQTVRSVAVVFEPVAPARARRAVEAAATSEEADEQLRMERGFRTTARRTKQRQATLQREKELAEGHQEMRFAGYVTVSARDLEELDLACDAVEQAAHQAYLDVQPLWGQQDLGFTQGALPICRGLRPSSPLGDV